MELTQNEQKALEMYVKGKKHSVSTFIDEDTIIAGYGQLDYDFEFPLPRFKIEEIYGTLSWAEKLYNEGYRRLNITNKVTKEVSSLTVHTNELKDIESSGLFDIEHIQQK